MAKVNPWYEESNRAAQKVWSALAEWIAKRPDVDFSTATALVLDARVQIEQTAPKRAFELLEAAEELGERLSQEDGFRREFLNRVSAIKGQLNKADPDGWALLEVVKFELDVTTMTNLEICEKRWDLILLLEGFEGKAAKIAASRAPKTRKNKGRDWGRSWAYLRYAPASA